MEDSVWGQDLSRCARSCPVVSYLLLAAGPRSSRFTGWVLSRHTFFTTDLSIVVASGASGCLAGSEGALSECRPLIWERFQEGSAPLEQPRFGSTSPLGWELLLLFFSSGEWFTLGGCDRVAILTPAGLTHAAAFLEDFWWQRVDSSKQVGKRVLGGFLRPSFQLWRWHRCWARSGEGRLKTLMK